MTQQERAKGLGVVSAMEAAWGGGTGGENASVDTQCLATVQEG